MIWLQAMLAAILVAVGDQLSKAAVLARRPTAVAAGHRPFISIHCMLNPRGTLAPFLGVSALVGLWVASVVLAILVLAYGAAGHGVLMPIGIGAGIGGAARNVLDPLRRGALVRFISVRPGPGVHPPHPPLLP